MAKRHKHIWKKYDGMLGYESLRCSICGVDINDLKRRPQTSFFSSEIVKTFDNRYSVRFKHKDPFGEKSQPIQSFVDEISAKAYQNKVMKDTKLKNEIRKIVRGY